MTPTASTITKRSLALPAFLASNPHRLAVDEEHVVGRPGLGGDLPHGHALRRGHRGVLVVLHYPAARFKLGVDLHPSPLLGIEILRWRVGGVSVRHRRAS